MASAVQPERPPLTIGLVNNMPDGAVQQTERQFRRLAGDTDVVWRRYSLPGVQRSPAMTAFLARHYDDPRAIGEHGLDGLIITGAEPRAAELREEPFWPALVAMLDWSEAAGLPLLLSCLAAHVAVLHRDGIGRRRLAAKSSGVFSFETVPHPLLAGLPSRIEIPHSRLNEVRGDDLEEAGWRILSRSAANGVDAFLREDGINWLCWQGHPEYEADTLLREFRRDLGRFLRGEQPSCPAPPDCATVFSDQGAIASCLERARRRPDERVLEELGRLAPAEAPWHATARRLFANWLALLPPTQSLTLPPAHLATLACQDPNATQRPGSATR